MTHDHLIQDHSFWVRERNRKQNDGQGVSWSSVQKPAKPVTWAEFEAMGIETPFDYENIFLPTRGWDDRAKSGVKLTS